MEKTTEEEEEEEEEVKAKKTEKITEQKEEEEVKAEKTEKTADEGRRRRRTALRYIIKPLTEVRQQHVRSKSL